MGEEGSEFLWENWLDKLMKHLSEYLILKMLFFQQSPLYNLP